ncbi:hypothetical protein ACWYXN_28345 [Janthinobacterium aestuarii]
MPAAQLTLLENRGRSLACKRRAHMDFLAAQFVWQEGDDRIAIAMVERHGYRIRLFAGRGQGDGSVICEGCCLVFAVGGALHKGFLYQIDHVGRQ